MTPAAAVVLPSQVIWIPFLLLLSFLVGISFHHQIAPLTCIITMTASDSSSSSSSSDNVNARTRSKTVHMASSAVKSETLTQADDDLSDDLGVTSPDAATAVVAEKKPESMLKSFLAGGFGGVCVVLTGHPLDLIKVRMQTAGGSASHSVVGMFVSTFRETGIRGLYRGVSAPLLATTPIFALSFWGYDLGQRTVRWMDSNCMTPTADLSLTQKCIAGGISAFPTTVVMAPSERIKCLLQTSSPGQYKGFTDCAADVFRTGGIRSLYRGTILTLFRDVPGSIAWFGTYELVKMEMMKLQGKSSDQLSPVAVVTAGGFAGMACWAVAIPPDVLKSRFQTAPEGTYHGILDVYRKLMQSEGPSALFAGLRPAMIRAFPANAACFLGMEWARKMLSFMD